MLEILGLLKTSAEGPSISVAKTTGSKPPSTVTWTFKSNRNDKNTGTQQY